MSRALPILVGLGMAATPAVAQPIVSPDAFMEGAWVLSRRGGAACTAAPPPTDAAGQVTGSPLLAKIFGAAAGTTGGLGAKVYRVDKLDDAKPSRSRPSPEGTVRWAVERARAAGGGWIVFDPSLEGSLKLEASLHLPSNTTLDGGCGNVEIVSAPAVTQITMSGSSNVVVAGLSFTKTAYDDKSDKTGDAIGITDAFDRAAILHNRFRRCGDGCVDIVRKTPSDALSRATIAFNAFEEHNKVMLIGSLTCYAKDRPEGCDDPSAHLEGPMKPRILVTIAANVFIGTSQRHPKAVSNAQVHLFNNLFELRPTAYSSGEDSAVYGASTGSAGMVFAEGNIFVNRLRAPRIGVGTISVVRASNGGGSEPDGFVAAWQNVTIGNVRIAEHKPDVARDAFAARHEAVPVSGERAIDMAACLLKVAGPKGRMLHWPVVCGP